MTHIIYQGIIIKQNSNNNIKNSSTKNQATEYFFNTGLDNIEEAKNYWANYSCSDCLDVNINAVTDPNTSQCIIEISGIIPTPFPTPTPTPTPTPSPTPTATPSPSSSSTPTPSIP